MTRGLVTQAPGALLNIFTVWRVNFIDHRSMSEIVIKFTMLWDVMKFTVWCWLYNIKCEILSCHRAGAERSNNEQWRAITSPPPHSLPPHSLPTHSLPPHSLPPHYPIINKEQNYVTWSLNCFNMLKYPVSTSTLYSYTVQGMQMIERESYSSLDCMNYKLQGPLVLWASLLVEYTILRTNCHRPRFAKYCSVIGSQNEGVRCISQDYLEPYYAGYAEKLEWANLFTFYFHNLMM